MLDCEATSRLIVPAFRVAMARRLVNDYGLSQNRAALIIGVKQASVSKYLSSSQSDSLGMAADYISSHHLEEKLVKMALTGTQKASISSALEKAATDPYLLRHVLSTKRLQLLKKTTSERV